MRAFLFLHVVFAMACANPAAAQAGLHGSWSREQHEEDRVTTWEVTFGRDGAFSQSISFTPRGSTKPMPVLHVQGRWQEAGGTITISTPSTAPIGVSPRPDRTFAWQIQKLTEIELSVIEKAGGARWEFSRKR